ncbi:MAG: HAD family hydrolase [Pseudomonadota bacterium]
MTRLRHGHDLRAWLLDLDGVVTDTAAVHARAWQELFDGYLAEIGAAEPFRQPEDYLDHIDGKPRYEGVRDFLASRGLELPWGSPDDAPDRQTVCGLGNRKNARFAAALEEGVTVFPGTLRLLDALDRLGQKAACVTSSRNGRKVLEQAGLLERFAVLVDGNVAAAQELRGKPEPDTYVHAAERLGARPAEAAVVEDALSGVRAGRNGAFGLVVGVDRGVGREALSQAGADVVVGDLAELLED